MNLGTHKIQSGQDLYDISNIVYGGLDYVYTLVQLNDFIVSVDDNLNYLAGRELCYNKDLTVGKAFGIELNPQPTISTIQYLKGLQNMSIWDAALMVYGDISMAYKLVIDNNLSSINDLSIAFKSLKFDTNENKNGALKFIIEKRGYVFASLYENSDTTYYRVTTSLEIRLTTSSEVRVTT